MQILRDGVIHEIDGSVSVMTTPDGHVIESWKSKGKRVYFANLYDSVFCAHGDTPAQAIGDAVWKDPKKRPSLDALVSEIKPNIKTRKITLNEFKLLTGACSTGCRDFLAARGLDQDVTMTLSEFMPIGGDWALKLQQVLT